MTTPEAGAEALVRRWFREVWDDGLEATVNELLDPEVQLHGAAPEPLVGVDAFKTFWNQTRTRFGDLSIDIDLIVVDGDRIASLCRSHFKDQDTHSDLTLRGASFARIRDGRFVEIHDTWNFGDLLEQSGVVPPGAVQASLQPRP